MVTMAFLKTITLTCAISILVDAKWTHQKREIPSNICDSTPNSTNLVQCYCSTDRKSEVIKNADCYLTDATLSPEHSAWKTFGALNNALKITFTNSRGIPLTYIPTESIKEAHSLSKFEIKYGMIERIEPFAFANKSSIEEISLRDNRISTLNPHAFAHHKNLKILSLDTNMLTEINRNVFIDLPALEKLFLTNNEISTIHDKAFIRLGHLRELEIDRNKVFSLNFATFEGLKSLEKLDLSGNALEVIGDNTFEALVNLKSLNLDENKIQMLDEKAFNGLGKLLSLSLARNKLTDIESDKTFEGLYSLQSLSLRGNQMKELKTVAIAPILSNFYGSNSNFDIEDNSFPCNCSLDWFISLMNKTLNKHLKITLENLKCVPDTALREAWTKSTETLESEKNMQVFEDEAQESQVNDYEYYDETQLNGKLFYLDVRDLLQCENYTKTQGVDNGQTKETNTTRRASSNKMTNQGSLDVSPVTTTASIGNIEMKTATDKRENDEKVFTTTRLATVSAKPVESKLYDAMASDEGRPDKIKSHRSVQDEIKDNPNTNNATKRISFTRLLVFIMLLSLDALVTY